MGKEGRSSLKNIKDEEYYSWMSSKDTSNLVPAQFLKMALAPHDFVGNFYLI